MWRSVEVRKQVRAFEAHRNRARRGLIPFEFELEEWIAWWEKHLGPDWMKKRGHFGHQYVMARHLDIGSYAPDNVKCITARENVLEIWDNKRKRRDRLRDFRIKHGLHPYKDTKRDLGCSLRKRKSRLTIF